MAPDGQFADEVLQLTDGVGVNVVYDGSGPKTFHDSLASLRRSGTFCWYGPVLGGQGPLDLISLPKSIKIGYATFFDHIPTTDLEREMAKRAGSNVTEIEASHAVFASQPEKVAEVIAKAARQIGK